LRRFLKAGGSLSDWQASCSHSSLTVQSIHLREKNIAGPTEKSRMRKRPLVRREGPAFFDEDDVCAVTWKLAAAYPIGRQAALTVR